MSDPARPVPWGRCRADAGRRTHPKGMRPAFSRMRVAIRRRSGAVVHAAEWWNHSSGAVRVAAIALLALLAVIAAPAAVAGAAAPEQDAEALRSGLFAAQTDLILGDRDTAQAEA